MLVLGLESSCDETAVALVSFNGEGRAAVVCEVIASQIDLHAQYGGVVPELASREHLRSFPLLLEELFQKVSSAPGKVGAVVGLESVTHVAVTAGPGLKGCLLIGVGVARAIAMTRNLPLLPINHIEGHVLSAFLSEPDLSFPYLALVVSGGHTELLRVEDVGSYQLLTRTMDDAAGEAFDKSASLLGLAYPGGPQLAKLAAQADLELSKKYLTQLPKVMRESAGFSFSGLKTAISLLVKRHQKDIEADERHRAALAAAVQDSIVDAICFKTKEAVESSKLSTLVLTGGVAANRALRTALTERLPRARVIVPPPEYCTDNAAMIAYVGGMRALRGELGNLSPSILSRWPIESMAIPVPESPGGVRAS